MSGEIWIHELEELRDIPVLEGELEWVVSVVDDDASSKQKHCFPTMTGYVEQE